MNIICSPFINAPVVCDTANSFTPVAFAFFARYPTAPLANPLILDPLIFSSGENNVFTFKIVNVWISYKCKSQSVVLPSYEESDTPQEYTLASPICIPLLAATALFLLWLYNSITFDSVPPILIKGAPVVRFTFSKLPILNGIDALLTVFVSLGLSISKTVVPGKYTSWPLTYALPGDNLIHIKSSLGVFPLSVTWFSVYSPPVAISSFNESWVVTRKGSTA